MTELLTCAVPAEAPALPPHGSQASMMDYGFFGNPSPRNCSFPKGTIIMDLNKLLVLRCVCVCPIFRPFPFCFVFYDPIIGPMVLTSWGSHNQGCWAGFRRIFTHTCWPNQGETFQERFKPTKTTSEDLTYIPSGWWYTYPSEKYTSSSVGMTIPFPAVSGKSWSIPWFQPTNQQWITI